MPQLLRYAVVGLLSNISGYLVYLLLTYLGLPPKVTMTLLYATGATVGYYGNKNLTFSYGSHTLGSGFRFLLSHIGGYLINLTILVTFVDRLGYPHQAVQAGGILLVATYLFLALKFFVFRNPA